MWGPIVGPLVAVISFVCSVGNIPLAAVLWNGGISFGGVVAFIFVDLIVLPILNIYRKYYGLKMAGFLFASFYIAMGVAALIVELIFGGFGFIPSERKARVIEASITWNYTTWLNLVFLILAGLLLWRFLKTGGLEMLRMMNRPAEPSPSPQEPRRSAIHTRSSHSTYTGGLSVWGTGGKAPCEYMCSELAQVPDVVGSFCNLRPARDPTSVLRSQQDVIRVLHKARNRSSTHMSEFYERARGGRTDLI
jgi:hypothetical protein